MKLVTKIPVILLTGFLGSGKTTFLNRQMKNPEFANSLIVVNEFGAVPVDHLLVESSTETIFELSNGCVCCSIRNDLVETLLRQDIDRFDRVFIETTGIADPVPVFQALEADPRIGRAMLPASIITMVDTERGMELIDEHLEARHQIAVADRILLSKTDRKQPDSSLSARLAGINPTAIITDASEVFDAQELVHQNTSKMRSRVPSKQHSKYQSTVLETDTRLTAQDFYGMLSLITNRLGNGLLRLKGFAVLEESPQPVVVQVSGSVIHDPVPAPENVGQHTLLVVITKDADPQMAKDIFDGFTGRPSPEVADRDALLENPLSIPGQGL